MTDSASAPEAARVAVEFHFTEVFTGQVARLRFGDGQTETPPLQTRFQTGLAHIEELELPDGEEVICELDDLDLQATITVDAMRPFVVVSLAGDRLDVAFEATSPGYL